MSAEEVQEATGEALRGLAQREFTFEQAHTLLSHLKQMKRNLNNSDNVQWNATALNGVIDAVNTVLEKAPGFKVVKVTTTTPPALSPQQRAALTRQNQCRYEGG